MRKSSVLSIVMAICIGPQLMAFSPIQSGHKKLSSYIREGAIVGGKSTGDYSLIKVRRQFLAKKGLERIVLDMGNEKGEPLLNTVNYYHISYSKNEIRIYFPRLIKYRMSLQGIESKLERSKLIDRAEVLSNPKEKSTSLILRVVSGVEIEAFHLPSRQKAARIVLDLIGKTK